MAKRPIYYDTETTGTRPDKDRIIELAAYDPLKDTTFDCLINPEVPIPKEATAIHNISDEMVAEAPSFEVVAKDFIEFCSGDVVLIAHNNDGFDKPFLEHEYHRHDVELPVWDYLDSLKWSRRYRPDLPRHSLQTLREHFGIAANNAHRALDDVVILHQVFSQMIGDLPIETVLELMSREEKIDSMPFGKYKGRPIERVPRDYVTWLLDNGALDKPENANLKKMFEKHGHIQS